MRRIPIALAVLSCAPWAAPGPATAASVRTLHAQRVATGGTWLGQAGATSIAFRNSASGPAAVTLTDAGRKAVVPAPAGCTATAVGGGRIAYACGAVAQTDPGSMLQPLAVTSLIGRQAVRLQRTLHAGADGSLPGSPEAVGDQWIRTGTAGYHGPFVDYFNWRTGEQRWGEPLDPHRVVDLDAPDLTTPLCSPLQAFPDPEPFAPPMDQLLPVTVRAPWVLVVTPRRAELHRCGTAEPVTLPAPFGAAAEVSPMLGDGWLAQPIFRGGTPSRVELLRLADRRRFTIRTTGYVGAVTHGRLYLLSGLTGQETISIVSLPRR